MFFENNKLRLQSFLVFDNKKSHEARYRHALYIPYILITQVSIIDFIYIVFLKI